MDHQRAGTDRNTAVQDRYDLPDGRFRRLTDAECAASRAWARANYKRGSEDRTDWHPVIRDEVKLMNEEAAR